MAEKYKDRDAALQKIAKHTKDEVLKKEIEDRLKKDSKLRKKYKYVYENYSEDHIEGDERFENQEVRLWHPFRTGDIVKVKFLGKKIIAVVNDCTTDKELDSLLNRKYYENLVIVESFNMREGFAHYHVRPMNIEFFDIEKYDGPDKEIYQSASWIYKGEGSLDQLFYAIRMYKGRILKKKKHKYREPYLTE